MTIKTQLIRIGNSRGIRIPKTILDQVNLSSEVELTVEDNKIVIQAAGAPRQSWEAAFARTSGEREELIPNDLVNQFDREDWTW